MRRGERTIALLAGGGGAQEGFGWLERRLASGVMRAALERGGRVLLGTDACTLLPLLMAALERRRPAPVESGEPEPPAIVLLPMARSEALEEAVFEPFERSKLSLDERAEEREPRNLVELFAALGVLEWGYAYGEEESVESRNDYFRLYRDFSPRAILAVGAGRGLRNALAGAQLFSREMGADLFVEGAGLREKVEGDWRPLETLLTKEEAQAPATLYEESSEDSERISAAVRAAAWESRVALAAEHFAERYFGAEDAALE